MDIAQEAPETVILAEDEMSLYLQATTTSVWAPRGLTPVVRADPGRAKTSFYGTLNLLTGQEIVTRSPVMNATASAAHLAQLLAAIPDRPILLLWDRAPWHSGQPIRDLLAANPRLELMSFPVAAPDCNPQEHVWRAARRAVSHNHDTAHLPALADKMEAFLTSHAFQSSFLDRFDFLPSRTLCSMSI